jgi:hypothetical protein
MKKIGLICMALVMALGIAGVGYASWTDTLYIDGTVETGDVDLDIKYLSQTWIYKVHEQVIPGDDFFWWHGWGTPNLVVEGPSDNADHYQLISSANGTINTQTQTITCEFDNLMPCQFYMIDWLFHYTGSIPARLSVNITSQTGIVPALISNNYMGVEAYNWTCGDTPGGTGCMGSAVTVEGLQVHDCDWYIMKVWIHIPQEGTQATFAGKTGSFDIEIEAIQWNEY